MHEPWLLVFGVARASASYCVHELWLLVFGVARASASYCVHEPWLLVFGVARASASYCLVNSQSRLATVQTMEEQPTDIVDRATARLELCLDVRSGLALGAP